jgi:murein DD-endopeptidase MepM/ murein hydrolase activator NlpD
LGLNDVRLKRVGFRFFAGLCWLFLLTACTEQGETSAPLPKVDASLLEQCPLASGFDFPIGPPNAKGYYNAQKFGENRHLGDDWNGNGGGNTDLGDPVYSVAEGVVVFAKDIRGGWGIVVRIVHNIGTKAKPKYVESVYAHLQRMDVLKGDVIMKGAPIGTIGTAHGRYKAHLHLEIRTDIDMEIGGGYSKNTKGFVDPTAYINQHRKIDR